MEELAGKITERITNSIPRQKPELTSTFLRTTEEENEFIKRNKDVDDKLSLSMCDLIDMYN